MQRLTEHHSFETITQTVEERLSAKGIKLTIGGEPSYVPIAPEGPEWNFTAIGPTKLQYAYALSDALTEKTLAGAAAFFSPGKCYPGEVNPRWAIHLVWRRDGAPLTATYAASEGRKKVSSSSLTELRRDLAARLKLKGRWYKAKDQRQPRSSVWVLPLDHDGKNWITGSWPIATTGDFSLINAEGPAGLRLPLSQLPPEAVQRALVLESKEDGLHIFFPPLLQAAFLKLLKIVEGAAKRARTGPFFFEGYIPGDDGGLWTRLSITADPGVLEINLPPCESAGMYEWWMKVLEEAGAAAGLRSYKQPSPEEILGTGGGNHILLGGPTLDENAFFRHPQWVTSILRYWQRHPSLSYLFTGSYVGASSQAPRPDESAGELYDLEMAYQFLENLAPGIDQRHLISDTLRHLHIDRSGNTHRSEISFDKFWNAGWDGGCRGLIEFRAVESLPHAGWMSAVALLWTSLAAFLFEERYTAHLVDHGSRLHDAFFLPTPLWEDFQAVLEDLWKAGFQFAPETFRQIWEYRFPQMLAHREGDQRLTVRKALESWPLLCETPVEGGTTSRFVDTSIERLEFTGSREFAAANRVFVQGRELKFSPYPDDQFGAGLRYRRSALYPSLHPGILPHIPLFVTITDRSRKPSATYKLEQSRRLFEPFSGEAPALTRQPCRKLRSELITFDLRLP